MKEMVTLNRKEQRRLVVLNQVETGKMTGRDADEILGLSLRHVRRLLVAYRKEGAAAISLTLHLVWLSILIPEGPSLEKFDRWFNQSLGKASCG